MPVLLHAWFTFLPPVLAVLGLAWGGAWLFLAPAWSLGVAVLLDLVVPPDRRPRQVGPGTQAALGLLTWLVLPVVGFVVGYGLWTVATVPLAWWEVWAAALAVGIVSGGIGINTAHELVHRRHAWERGLGIALLSLTLYAHFRIEHVHGHHRRVATPEDPATARLGEGVYAFYARTVPAQWRSAWVLEAERLARRGHSVWSWRNRMLWYTGAQLGLLVLVPALFGPLALLFFLLQALVAVQLLETVNYVEHYGLERRPTRPGSFEPVRPKHSWDSAHRLTNWTLFNLGLHADHHTHAGKAYAELQPEPQSPQMPTGYSGMVLLALVPPLWHRVMDPRVRAWREAPSLSAAG